MSTGPLVKSKLVQTACTHWLIF